MSLSRQEDLMIAQQRELEARRQLWIELTHLIKRIDRPFAKFFLKKFFGLKKQR